MRGSAAFRSAIAPGGLLAGPWVQNELWRRAKAKPSLDLRFAENKSLVDATTGQNLVTFTRASSGTYVDSEGVIRRAVTNLLLRSEEFDNAIWSKSQCTITANDHPAPNGTLTADRLTATGTDGYVQQYPITGVASGAILTASVWIKGIGSTIGKTGFIAVATNSGIGTSATFTITGSWQRVSVTRTTPAGDSNGGVRIDFCDPTAVNDEVYLWGAQLEQSSTVGEYIPTTSTINSAPRFDHNPTTGESLGLLVEEARTNSIRNNTMVGAVAGTPGTLPTNWTYAVGSGGLSRAIVGIGTENGINYIDIRFYGTTTNANPIAIGIDSGAAATGQTWTGSLYWKLVGGSLTGITGSTVGLIENTSGGSFVTGAFYTASNPSNAALSLQRVVATRTLSGGATVAFCALVLNFNVTNSTAIDVTLRLGMPQLEQGAFATSVIPTTSATATRSADVASISGSNFSVWYRQDEGTVFVDGRTNATHGGTNSFPRLFALNDGSNNNMIEGYLRVLASYTDAGYRVDAAGVNQAQADTNNQRNGQKQSIGYAANNFAFAVGGTIANTDTLGSIPVITQLRFGARSDGSSVVNGVIGRLAYWPVRLGNETLQRITQ